MRVDMKLTAGSKFKFGHVIHPSFRQGILHRSLAAASWLIGVITLSITSIVISIVVEIQIVFFNVNWPGHPPPFLGLPPPLLPLQVGFPFDVTIHKPPLPSHPLNLGASSRGVILHVKLQEIA